ncbi:MAG: Hsp20/alpha crystallin family protein [Flavobacteriaceae bacterium]|nr:Hsp20/alpha crystallin family protein [Flavobacteriaceae bacterium]
METIPLVIENSNDFLCETEENLLAGNSLMLATSMVIINLYEEKASYKLRATTSDFSRYQFDVGIKDRILSICAKRQRSNKSHKKRLPFGVDTFFKSFNIPKTVVVEKIKVYSRNGFLTIEMPKWEYVY